MCELQLTYGKTRHTLEGYADADSSMAKDWCTISGYAFLINGGAISWSSKWQEIMSLVLLQLTFVALVENQIK
jgi:hypothetical protein